MQFEHDLRVRVKERRNRLYRSGFQRFDNERRLMLAWMESEPYLRALLAEIDAADADYPAWLQAFGASRQLQFPDDERQRAKLCLAVLREESSRTAAHLISSATNFDDQMRDYCENYVDILVHYLEDRIEDGSAILAVLSRYKRRVEWFEQAQLFDLYETDSARGEDHLDAHLRRYLLDQGVDFPFSQPRSPSGAADIVAEFDEVPLPLEVKLFLPEASKDRAYVRQGFSQAYRYAADYQSPVGYLLVFNLTPGALIVTGENTGRWPPAVTIGDKTIFVITVDVNSARPKASKDRKLARHEIDANYLLQS